MEEMMDFKLKKWRIFNKVLLVVIVAYVLDILLPMVNLSLFKGFITVFAACFLYFVLRTQNEKYTINGKNLILSKSKMEIPISEIEELSRVNIPLLQKLGLKNDSIGYHYFLSYNGNQFELLPGCKNSENESITNVISKKSKLKFNDVENMKLFLKKHKENKAKLKSNS